MNTSSKTWDGLTTTGQLPIGVMYAGTRHKAFTLRVGVAGDMVAAQQEYHQPGLQLISVVAYRRQLLSLGDIPPEALTTELLLEQLTEIDLAFLAKADEELEKKLTLPSEAALLPGAASSTPLSATATA